MSSHRYIRGISVVEIVVAAGIILTAVTGIAGAWQLYFKISNKSAQYSQVSTIIEEGEEALNLMRDMSWSGNISPLSLNTTYYIYWNGSAYVATTTLQTIQNTYVRTISFQSIQRDVNFNIASSGSVDVNTRKAVITIFPSGNASTTLAQSEMLIHNVFNN